VVALFASGWLVVKKCVPSFVLYRRYRGNGAGVPVAFRVVGDAFVRVDGEVGDDRRLLGLRRRVDVAAVELVIEPVDRDRARVLRRVRVERDAFVREARIRGLDLDLLRLAGGVEVPSRVEVIEAVHGVSAAFAALTASAATIAPNANAARRRMLLRAVWLDMVVSPFITCLRVLDRSIWCSCASSPARTHCPRGHRRPIIPAQ
jgi:hypothetical protein